MWVVLRNVSPLGLTSANWLYKTIAAIIAAILCTVVLSSNALAADATWEGGSIKYGDVKLNGPKKAPANSPLKIPEGSEYYESASRNGKVTVIYFTPGTDVDQASGAQVAEYKFSAPNNYVQEGSTKTISIDKKADSGGAENGDSGEAGDEDKDVSTCAVNQLGYIVCPIMGVMAEVTDRFFNWLQSMLEVKPILGDRESPMFKGWSMMVSIANVAFIIAFLLMVYSYLTSYGIKQYDIRYMAPRIVVAALLVNVSFYICALLVDVSNILGATIQDMLLNLRHDMMQDQTMNQMTMPTFVEITAFALSGGALAATALVQLSAGGTVWLLMPVLTVAILAIFVTVAVLAARQALITVLIIISPLAFVAFVLPSTQKYFDKWREIFQTMLLMYPIFSVIFGGSQLASYIIAQTADSSEVLIIAMFVSMAPLIITPFLIRFSGSLLGKFAGIVNNPSKGIFDRAKNFAQDRRDLKRADRQANNARFSGLARWADDRKRLHQGRRALYDKINQASFDERKGRGLAIEQWRADDRAAAAEDSNRSAYAELRYRDKSMQLEEAGNRMQKQMRTINEGRVDAMMNELKTKEGVKRYSSENVALAALGSRIHQMHEDEYVVESRKAFARDTARAELAGDMLKNEALQAAAAGIAGEKGRAVAAARAVSDLHNDFGEGAKAVSKLMDHFKLDGSDINKLAMREGGPVTKTRADGSAFKFDFNDAYTFEAAVDKLVNEKGNMEQKMKLVMRSGEAEYADVRATIAEGVKKTMVATAPQLGGRGLDIIETTGIDANNPTEQIADLSRDLVLKGKVSQSTMANWDAYALQNAYEAIKDQSNYGGISRANRVQYDGNRLEFIKAAGATLKNEQINGSIRDNTKAVLQEIARLDPLYKE